MKAKKEETTIEEFAKKAMKSTSTQYEQLYNESPSILLGSRSGRLTTRKRELEIGNKYANELLSAYTEFYKGKSKSWETFENEILPLTKLSDADVDFQLRIRFIEVFKIEIPAFARLKKSKTVELIEYSESEEDGFSELKELIFEFKLVMQRNSMYQNMFNSKSQEFTITKEIIQELEEEHKVFASDDQVQEFLALSLIAEGLNHLPAFRRNDINIATLPPIIKSHVTRDFMGNISLNTESLKAKFGFNEVHSKIVIKRNKKEDDSEADESED